METQRCENCRNWDPDEPSGQCRAQPPVVVDSSGKTKFPRIEPSEWCASWKRRADMAGDVRNAVAPRDMAPGE